MSGEHLASNFTCTENDTDIFDSYCTKSLVGFLVWSCCTVTSACVGLPASLWLLGVFAQRMHRGLAIDVYSLNFTIMDFIFNANIPLAIINTLTWKHDFFQKAAPIILSLVGTGRPLISLCICFDCYMAAVFPIRYMKMKHTRYRLITCALVWSLTFLHGALYIINLKLLFTPVLVTPFALSLPPIVFLDVAVLHALQKPDPSGRRDVHPQKSKALQKITFNLAVTLVVYFPQVVVLGFSSLVTLNPQDYFCNVSIPASTPAAIFSSIMPLLYLRQLGILKDVMSRVSACRGPVRNVGP